MPTIAARIFHSLAEEIVNGALLPGTKLDEQILADRFQVSRTPVREALREMGARGLIELVPRRGGIVANIGLTELADMLEAECEVEALCAQLAAQRMSTLEKKQLERLHDQSKQLVTAADQGSYLAQNRKFHDLICAGTHNNTIAGMVRGLRDRLSAFRHAQSGTEKRLEVSHAEHEGVVRAILASDGTGAYAAMRDHNARLSSRVLERLAQSPRQGNTTH